MLVRKSVFIDVEYDFTLITTLEYTKYRFWPWRIGTTMRLYWFDGKYWRHHPDGSHVDNESLSAWLTEQLEGYNRGDIITLNLEDIEESAQLQEA